MAIAESQPIRFTPVGVSDAFDSTDKFPGSCRSLANLVFDQSNPSQVIPRPGVGSALTSFAGFSSPGFISVHTTIGNLVYGMVATSLTAGKDEPFCYNLTTSSFVTISNVTSGNSEGRPTSPPTSGAWTPPTMAVIGVKLIITHPGYSGTGSNFFGVIDISNPLAPAYSTVNTSTHGLPSVPTYVANYNNRAYFACGNAIYYSDVLTPLVMTNAGQALTAGDTTPVTALSGLPIQTTSAGVAGALIVFKSTSIWQITGDAAITGTLAINYLSLTVGSIAPRSMTPSPLGTIFVSQDSCYVVNPLGAVFPLANNLGQMNATSDLRQPFIYASQPSRIAASYANGTYRLCVATVIDGAPTTNDYWFDTKRMRWNGPHSFNYDAASTNGSTFILSGSGSGAKLFSSSVAPLSTSVYNDNGVQFNCIMQTADFQNRGEMAMKQVIESTIALAASGSRATFALQALDGDGNFVANATVSTNPSGASWGSNVWGDGTIWKSSLVQAQTYLIYWPTPIVFNRMSLNVSCVAASGIAIDTFYARTQKTGYTLQIQG